MHALYVAHQSLYWETPMYNCHVISYCIYTFLCLSFCLYRYAMGMFCLVTCDTCVCSGSISGKIIELGAIRWEYCDCACVWE